MKRTYVRITLRLESRWRVGAWHSSSADTLPTLTNIDGQPVAPGSGIAGSLRHALGDKEQQKLLFGPGPGTKSLCASPWWVLGTLVTDAAINQRQRNRIDRVRNSAAENALYRVEEVGPVPSGGDESIPQTQVLVYLRREHDGAVLDDEILAPLLEALRKWQPQIGGGASIGMGRAVITEMLHRTVDLDQDDGLRAMVCARGTTPVERVDDLLKGATATPLEQLISVSTPWLEAKLKVDFLALTDASNDRVHGSSWKGLLRSRVEYIGRSLGYEICGTTEKDCTNCGSCPVCKAFGSSEKPGLLAFDDSLFLGNVKNHGDRPCRQRTAIDRFTGGVRNGALWSQLYLEDVELALVIRRNPMIIDSAAQPIDDWVELAILHALRDLSDGLIAIGPEGAAGYGTAQITELKVHGKGLRLDEVRAVCSSENTQEAQ